MIEATIGTNEEGKDFIDIETKIDSIRVNMTKYIYETVDKLILENMPQDHLEKLYTQLGAEIQRRIIS